MTCPAHYQAAVHPEVGRLHRDVSGGNVLMYPRVHEVNGSYYLRHQEKPNSRIISNDT